MIKDLEKININDEYINKINDLYDYDVILSLACNYELINKNIELLSSYGIKNIEDLFVNKYFIFTEETEALIKKFSKFNIPVLASIINEDYSIIDEILN